MSTPGSGHRLILASGSATRQAMLRSAGLLFDADPARIDEDALRAALQSRVPPLSHAQIAIELAKAKATEVSNRHPDGIVIGSDQILSTGPEILNKPATIDEARATLRTLRGNTHWLHSGVALASKGDVLWSTANTARLTMHAFSDVFLNTYLAEAGNDILGCVGAYQIEGPGIRLFESVEGDHATILGMPLIPLLNELRRRQEIAA